MSESLEKRYRESPLSGSNAMAVEQLYEAFLADPASVDTDWRRYFESLPGAGSVERPHGVVRDRFATSARHWGQSRGVSAATKDVGLLEKQAAVQHLIERYRLIGHKAARLDPLGLAAPEKLPDLEPGHFDLTDTDLDRVFSTGNLADHRPMTLRNLTASLKSIYCGPVGAEFVHVSNTEERRWLQEKFERTGASAKLDPDEKKHLLRMLVAAEGIERYLHTRYVGQKRFSLEGGESLIALLDDVVQQGGRSGINDIVFGMAHRGRINVLVNIVGKSPKELFSEFEGQYDPTAGSGDVKYHLGYSTDVRTPGGNVHVVLAFNPSHLEIVDPVVQGSVRARQDRRNDSHGDKVMPVLIHGDAAFAGQGVVMETLQMSQTRGFKTGGTLHIVCNNQIGFTISEPQDARSTRYCTDVAKMVEAPVFHVNADNPNAVILVARLALEYRMKFKKDVVIDLVCYRRHGHNEADEPAATQPQMYKAIRQHPTVREIYRDRLVSEGVVTEEEANTMSEEYRAGLDEGRSMSWAALGMIANEYTIDWSPFQSVDFSQGCETGIEPSRLESLGQSITHMPEDVRVHPRVQRIVDDRVKMAAGEIPMDWGFAEIMAYGSLLAEGYHVRLTGQDSGRGTFFHRHAVWHNQDRDDEYVALNNLGGKQGRFEVIDSLLSEEAVLGFEYGYATAEPKALVIWEGQFGDFVNGAQVVIDQFISSGESKWGRYCGLVMFLPHGYEGQGPEHSSARLERFLQLCAEHNMQVCAPSTPAQMFHLLRRQMARDFRKPLVVMTPKSLLRNKLSFSSLNRLQQGGFQDLIGEIDPLVAEKVTRVVFCSGKVYYDLLKVRREKKIDDAAICRVEQLYPFPGDEYAAQLEIFKNARKIVWCQEEPENQGAWYQIRHRLQMPLKPAHELEYVGRAHAAAPAAGHFRMHQEQQNKLVAEALSDADKQAVRSVSKRAS